MIGSWKLGRAGLAAMVLGLVAACGNAPDRENGFTLVRDLIRANGGTAGTSISNAELARVLQNTTSSVVLLDLEKANSRAAFVQIERNRAYRTYATAARQTVTIKGGMVTATRGLGGDLMSADVDQTLALVQRREAGLSKRNLRFLSGDERTIDMAFDCVISRDGQAEGLQKMREDCREGAQTFINTYLVDQNGSIRASRQWIGTFNDYLSVATLRD